MMLLLYFLSPAKTWNLLNHISRTGCQVWGCTNQRLVYVYTFIRSVEPYMYSHLYKGGSRIFPVGGCLFLLSINKFHYWNMNAFEIFRGSAPPAPPSNRPPDPLMTSRSRVVPGAVTPRLHTYLYGSFILQPPLAFIDRINVT